MSTQLAAATSLLSGVKEAKILVETSLTSKTFGAQVGPGTILRLEGEIADKKVVLDKTKATVVDDVSDPTNTSYCFGAANLDLLYLWERDKGCSKVFDVCARGKLLCFPAWKTLVSDIPKNVEDLAVWAETAVSSASVVPATTGKPAEKLSKDPEQESPSMVRLSLEKAKTKIEEKIPSSKREKKPRHMRFEVSFKLDAGAKIDLNEGTRINVAEGGSATVTLIGMQDFAMATVTGTKVSVTTPMFSTGPSDVDMQVTLNRREAGTHIIAFNSATLRDVKFTVSDVTPPPIQELRIVATPGRNSEKTYDFVITVDPNNTFTFDMLVETFTRRISDPDVIAALKAKLAGAADGAADDDGPSVPSVITLTSGRWNVLDYVTHDGRGHFASAMDLPHIRLGLQEPAMREIFRNALPHLRLFMAATQLQNASRFDVAQLTKLANTALVPPLSGAILRLDRELQPKLLRTLGLTAAEAGSQTPDLKRAQAFLESAEAGDTELAERIAPILVKIGNELNEQQRGILRKLWVEAGGMNQNGRAYVLMAGFVNALHASVEGDADAPQAVRELLPLVPTGPALHAKIAVASDNLRGAIWASQNVLPDGWGPVSERLEKEVQSLFGNPNLPSDEVPRVGTSVFREQAASAAKTSERFFDASVRFIGNGEEFLQQIIKLLDDTSAARKVSATKGTVVLNYWSFEAIYASDTEKLNVWGIKIAEKLKELALDGFSVNVVVDEKNGPSRRGQIGLSKIAKEVEATGKGSFALHAWLPSDERFPLGTHVKYIVTPLGVIAGGGNLGDHYAHWSDTNLLLRGSEVVQRFAAHHDAILKEQRAIGHNIAPVPLVQAGDPRAWTPLTTHVHKKEDEAVFQPDWEASGVRLFRDQGGDPHDRILVEHLAALDAARGAGGGLPAQTVYIANCYLALPQPVDENPLARALFRALERGVNIEVITNTVDSIDQPIVAGPVIKTVFLLMKRAREIGQNAAERGGVAGIFTAHLPSSDFIAKDLDDVPEVLIHDKLMFMENLALVGTHNFHPRSFTMEQEFLTELLGDAQPPDGKTHERFLERARDYFKAVMGKPGGERIDAMDELMGPLEWRGTVPPALWGPAALAYMLFQEKKWLYCHSYSSRTDEEVKKVEGLLDVSTKASFPDLIINAF